MTAPKSAMFFSEVSVTSYKSRSAAKKGIIKRLANQRPSASMIIVTNPYSEAFLHPIGRNFLLEFLSREFVPSQIKKFKF